MHHGRRRERKTSAVGDDPLTGTHRGGFGLVEGADGDERGGTGGKVESAGVDEKAQRATERR